MRKLLVIALVIFSTAAARAQGTTNYPGSLDTAVTCPESVDLKFTYLTAALTNSATTVTVDSTAGVPASGVLQIDSELLSYTTATGTTFAVMRAFSGTAAAAHAINATVRFPLSAAHVNCVRGAALAIEAKLGTGASPAASASTGHVLTKQADGTTQWAAAGQAADATLTALAAYNTNGLLTQTAADTFTGRTLTGTANQITVMNGNGVSGNPTVSLPSAVTTGSLTLNSATGNALVVDSNVLAVDATNDRVGVRTTSPQATLHLVGDPATAQVLRLEGDSSATTLTAQIFWAFYNPNVTANNYANFFFQTNDTGGTRRNAAGIAGIFTARTATTVSGALSFSTVDAGTFAERWRINSAGHLIGGADNTYDVGDAAATRRPRTGYFGTSVVAPKLNLSATITPSSTADAQGDVGDVRRDDNYIYVKTSAGWKRAALSTF